MPRSLSPEEWDALSARQRRAAGPRPTQEQFAAATAALAANAEKNSRIEKMFAVGGREWQGCNGQHRIYFDMFLIPRYDHTRGVVDGYYDVNADRFVSAGHQGMTDDAFAAFIVPIIERGWDLPPDAAVTFDAMGAPIRKGDRCMLVTPRDTRCRNAARPNLDVRSNVGRVVIAWERVTNNPGLHTHWHIRPENPDEPLVAEGCSFVCDQGWLVVRSTSLMLIGPDRGSGVEQKPRIKETT